MPLVLDSSLTRYNIETFAGKVLDVGGRSVADRAEVIQWDPTGDTNQQWYLDLCGADVYRIIARHSGRVLDLSGPDGAGSKIWQFAWAAADNQRWHIVEQQGGMVEIVSAWKAGPGDPDLVLDVAGGSRDHGAAIIAWTPNGGDNQRFRLKAAA
jgi:hypothetical protein